MTINKEERRLRKRYSYIPTSHCVACTKKNRDIRIRCYVNNQWLNLCTDCTLVLNIEMNQICEIVITRLWERMDIWGPWVSSKFLRWCTEMNFMHCGVNDLLSIQPGSKNSHTPTTYQLKPRVFHRKTGNGSLELVIGIKYIKWIGGDLSRAVLGGYPYECGCFYVPTESADGRNPRVMGGGTVDQGYGRQGDTLCR